MEYTWLPLCFAILAALPTYGDVKVKIATVANEFTPYAGPGLPEPVSMSNYSFEINEETRRARIVVDFSYENEAVYAGYDGHRPEPTYAQIPGLSYDAANHEVVYEHGSERTVCAVVEQKKGLRGSHSKVRATGNCVVSAVNSAHAEDDGWKIQRFKAIDVYFETR